MLLWWLLALCVGPEERDPPEAGDAQQDAWEAAGWGSPEPSEPGPERDESELSGPKPEHSEPGPEPDERKPEHDERKPEPSEPKPEPDAADRVKVTDVLSGSLRLTGSFLHFDDEPALFPTGDDALLLTVGRVLLEADASEHVHVSFNGFGELSRVPFGAGLGGTFASAGSTESAYRTRYLTWKFWQQGSVGGQLGVDRLALRLRFDSLNVDIGRFPITYAVTGMFTINDFFAPFSATAVNRIYKPGVDAVRLSAGITATSSVDVMGVLGYDPDSDRPSWGRSAMLTRAAIVGAGVEWGVLGGKVAQRWVAGGSIQAGLGPVDLRAEFHVGIPDEHGDGHDAADRPVYGRVAGGPSMSFAWHNAGISAEYLYASDGAAGPRGYVTRAQARFTDDLPYLGRHHVGAAAGLEIIPILRMTATGLVSATDGSGLAGVSVAYSIADESDLLLGVFVPWGAGLRAFDPSAGVVELGSEFGLAPVSAYLEARVFF